MAKMTDQDLLSVLNAERDAAYQTASGRLSQERERALRDYHRLPYGTEMEGRSQIVSSDVFDAVEGMLPDLIEVFTSTDKAVVFEPVGPEDEESADQVTQACNHVFYKQNNGFLALYSAVKDGLLQKTGGIKWWWDEKDTPTFDYRVATEMQAATFLATNPDAEILERTPQDPTEEQLAQAQQAGIQIPPLFRFKVKRVKKTGKVSLCAVPADELRVSPRHDSVLLDDCPYVAHVARRTVSQIRQMGYQVTVDDVRAAKDESTSQDRELRDILADDADNRNDDSEDDSQERGWLREEYVLVDYDGDGLAERRKVIRLGDKILDNCECSHVPIAAWTPYILTHQFHGFSVADLVTDMQRIRTDIWRAQLDNLDLANNQETVVQTDSSGNPLANIDDLLNRRPGGILREQAPNAIRPFMQRWQGIEANPMLEALEVAKENRTGFTRYSQGLDSDSLNKTATGVTKIMNASQKRMKLMARICAETLVAPMFRGIFKTLQDYSMEALSFRLNGKFVQYDPQNWRDGYDMSINVGIGTGDQIQMQGHLTAIGQAQFALMQSPFGPMLVDPVNVYELQTELAQNAGFKNPGRFFSDPRQKPPPQPQPDPRVAIEQAKLQAEQQKFQIETAIGEQRAQADAARQVEIDRSRQEMEARQKTIELDQQAQIERERIASNERIKAAELDFQRWAKQLDISAQLRTSMMAQQQQQQAAEEMEPEDDANELES